MCSISRVMRSCFFLELCQFGTYFNESQFPTSVRHSVGAGAMLDSPIPSLQIVNCFDLFVQRVYASGDMSFFHNQHLRSMTTQAPAGSPRLLLFTGERK